MPDMNYGDCREKYLQVTMSQLTQINDLLGPTVKVAAAKWLLFYYINADLLSDCKKGETYYKARSILMSLPVVTIPNLIPDEIILLGGL